MKTTGRRILSLVLCLVMVLALVPASVSAADDCGGDPNVCALHQFTDAPKYTNWAHAGIEYCVVNGLMGGTSATTFEPKTPMSRAMLVTVLYRMEGQPGAGSTTFTDVPGGKWFSAAVSWAADHGIVTGKGDGIFDPNGNVTREQIATILYRYASYKGYSTANKDNLNGFADASKVGKWFVDGMQWAVAEGLINGSARDGKTYLTPQGDATREQVAAILMRFCQNTGAGTAESLRIKTQPQNVKTELEKMVTFTVEVEGGKAPYTYQWQYRYVKDGAYLSWMDLTANWATGAKTNQLTMRATTGDINMQYEYRCVVTDAAGSQVISEAAHVVERTPLIISRQPQDPKACAGKQVEFSVEASGGTAPYSYQWQYKTSDMSTWEPVKDRGIGAKGPTLHWTVESQQLIKSYRFRCVVTDADGETVNSAYAEFSLYSHVRIATQPNDLMVNVGSPVALSVTAEYGALPYSYRWQFRYKLNGTYSDWQNVSGSWAQGYDTNYLTFKVTQEDLDNAYQYRCVVTDAYGEKAISRIGSILPTNAPLAFEVQPQDIECEVEKLAEFTAQPIGGKPPYTYQWQFKSTEFDWVSMNDAMWRGKYTDTLSFTVTEGQLKYEYRYRLMVTDSAGKKIYSDVVTVLPQLRITTQPHDSYANVGSLADFQVWVTDGVIPCTYQWQICRLLENDTFTNWSNVSDSWSSGGQTNQFSFTVGSDEVARNYFYRCVVTDAWGYQVVSNPVRVSLWMSITTQPKWTSKSATNGPATTEVEVTGGIPPYTYQWYWLRYGEYDLLHDEPYPCTKPALWIGQTSYLETYFYCVVTDSMGQRRETQTLKW